MYNSYDNETINLVIRGISKQDLMIALFHGNDDEKPFYLSCQYDFAEDVKKSQIDKFAKALRECEDDCGLVMKISSVEIIQDKRSEYYRLKGKLIYHPGDQYQISLHKFSGVYLPHLKRFNAEITLTPTHQPN